ncbi:hypothetical protein tinsulaeT_29750 [Thalassotalea insulae]|uniref:Uncharacterized protein n=1 Tax=Thalassotalea insulae TaxID=2056778 RepID=A0ABQ6GUM6_9GAMM|nr:hypothetical protein [Thalassotalea insulae]GLX79635.1 hypothetical protein tinsulaeT_29750 [Thalassotalea insulae]
MKNISITIALSSIFLFSCGGGSESGGDTATKTSKKDPTVNLSNTAWKKACSPYNKLSTDDSATSWNVEISLRIDSSLKATYKARYFRPTDTTCESMMFDTLDISKFEIKGKVTSEESVVAYGLNETFIYSSENNNPPTNYTLIYIDSEKLYFGQKSGSNLGETSQTRHSSISLNDYFTQVIN